MLMWLLKGTLLPRAQRRFSLAFLSQLVSFLRLLRFLKSKEAVTFEGLAKFGRKTLDIALVTCDTTFIAGDEQKTSLTCTIKHLDN